MNNKEEFEISEKHKNCIEIMQMLHSGVVIYEYEESSKNFRIVFFNQKAANIENVKSDNVIGKLVTEAFPGSVKFGIIDILYDVYQSGKNLHFPVKWYEDKDLKGWRENYVYKLSEKQVIVFYDDVSETKLLEHELSRKVKELELAKRIINLSEVVACRWLNKKGYPVDYVTENIESVIGYTKEEMLASTPSYLEIIHPDDKSKFMLSRSKGYMHSVDDFTTNDYRVYNKKGDITHIKERIIPVFGSSGSIIYFKGLIADFSKEIVADKKAQLYEKQLQLKDKNETIGFVTRKISHDFKNIVNSISGYIDLAKKNVSNPEQLQKYLEKLDSVSDQAQGLIEQIGDISERKQSQSVWYNLNSLIDQVSTVFLPETLSGTVIKYETKYSYIVIRGDRSAQHKILLNLVSNAVKAVTNTSNPEVKISSQIHSINNDEFELVIRVSDNGIGINKNDLSLIFEPHFTTDKESGTGLGLAIVKEIVDSNNGNISVSSCEGEGTEFIITQKYSVSDIQFTDESNSEERPNILVIDDDELLLQMVSDILSSNGYNVISYTSAQKAFEYFTKKANSIDLIISDNNLSDHRGIKFYKEIRTIDDDKPVIIISGEESNDFKELINNAPESKLSFLYKPFDEEELLINIKVALS